MSKHKVTEILLVVLCGWVLFISGCGGSSSDDDNGTAPAALTTFGEEAAQCTPQVETSAASFEVGYKGPISVGAIDTWAGWDPALYDPNSDSSILASLLTPDCIYGMFDPIDKADMIIGALNTVRDYWLTDGRFDDVTIPITIATTSATLAVTMTVDNSIKSVTVPYFGSAPYSLPDQAVDRVITLSGTIDDGTSTDTINAQIAFATSDAGEVLVVRTTFTDKGETSMFYGIKDSGVLDAYAACYVDNDLPDSDFQMALHWRGVPADNTFALTQYRIGGYTAKILAGGTVAGDGDMAFLAERSDDIDYPDTPYYVLCTNALLNGTGTTTPHDGSSLGTEDTDVLQFIEDGNPSCLGFLPAVPADSSEIPSMLP